MKGFYFIFVLPCVTTAQQLGGNSIGDFVGQLTNLIGQNGGIGNIVNNLQQNQADNGGFGVYQRPGHPPILTGPSYPRPEKPYPPPPYYENLHQNGHPGFVNALASIARYDDLKCVPRLLCEVTSGGKPGYAGTSAPSGSSSNRETLIGLLTVLNFIDESPLLTFGRAALIGYTARGNSRACIDAYPTCPRDPDALVDYLNNHNGGFFRFFGGSPQNTGHPIYPEQGPSNYQGYYHQGQPHYGNYYDGNRYPQSPYKKYRNDENAEGISPYSQASAYDEEDPYSAYNYAGATQFYQGRIQNRPYPMLSVEGHDSPLAFQHFQNYEQQSEDSWKPQNDSRLVFPQRKGKTLVFPGEDNQPSNNAGFFPDRTGTGNLLLSSQGVHYYNGPPDLVNFRDQRSIKFPSQMHFPHF